MHLPRVPWETKEVDWVTKADERQSKAELALPGVNKANCRDSQSDLEKVRRGGSGEKDQHAHVRCGQSETWNPALQIQLSDYAITVF